MAITASQQKYLKERLHEVRLTKPRPYRSKNPVMPKEVSRAIQEIERLKKTIKAWEDSANDAQVKRYQAVEAAYHGVMQAIMFGTSEEAVQALKDFETKKF